MAKSMHSMRIDDELWSNFMSRAQAEGSNGSQTIAELMQTYLNGSDAQFAEVTPEIKSQFIARAASEGISATEALSALMTFYIEGQITFKKTVKAVLMK